MESTEYDDDFDDDDDGGGGSKLVVSFRRIMVLFCNLQRLTLIDHTLSDEVMMQFVEFLNESKSGGSLQLIAFHFPKFKKLPRKLAVDQLQYVWMQYLEPHKWTIEGCEYGQCPMIVLRRDHCKLTPFMGSQSN